MDLILIYTYRVSETTNYLNKMIPLGVHYIQSFVQANGYTAQVKVLPSSELIDFLDSVMPTTKLIGFSSFEDNIPIISNCIKYIKKHSYCKVTVGGPQAYALTQDFLTETGCDTIVKGDGELATKQLLDYYIYSIGELSSIQGLIAKDKDNFINTGIAAQIENLDELPFPNIDYSKNNIAYIITGRGCPYSCAFCYDGVRSRSVRLRSVENVIQEIDYILKNYPNITLIQFVDDTFTLDLERVKKFCEYFNNVRKTRYVEWMCEIHVNLISRNLYIIDQMVESGLIAMQIGLESGCNEVLKAYNKHTTAQMILDFVTYCKLHGVKTIQGNFILGGALESEKSVNDSMELAKKLLTVGKGMMEISTVFFWPFPNTPITRDSKAYGLEINQEAKNNTILSMHTPVSSSTEMSTQQIIYAQKKFDMILSTLAQNLSLQLNEQEISVHWDKERKCFKNYWGRFLGQNQYMVNYMLAKDSVVKDLSKYSDDEIYPIRTVITLQYKDDAVICGGCLYSGIQRKILEFANGKKSIKEMAEDLNVNTKIIKEEGEKLKEKLMLYFSLC